MIPQLPIFSHDYFLPIALIILASCFSLFLAVLILKLYLLRQQVHSKQILFEITPPHDANQTPLATEQFLTIIHSLGKQKSWIDRLLDRKNMYALEVVSTREKGIRFLIRANADEGQIIKKHILSFLPGVKVTPVDDYLPSDVENLDKPYWRTVSLRLSRHFSLPLQEQKQLNQHDPIAYITGQMTKLEDKELVAVQFVLTPAMHTRESIQSTGMTVRFLLNSLVFLLLTPLTLVGWILFQDKKDPLPFWLFEAKKQDNKLPVVEKIDRELFEVSIRLCVSQLTKKKLKERITGLVTSFAGFQNVNQQGFRVKRQAPLVEGITIFKKFFFLQLKHRLLALEENPLLSAGEVAGLFHFPSATTQTEDLVNSKSKRLPAPLSLKQTDKKLDTVFANNIYAETVTPIGLTKDERRRHVYVLGAMLSLNVFV